MKQRAIDDTDKELRRNSLLKGARELYLANPRQLPTVAAIADTCKLAKGTVYLYFKSKEEIFVALLGEDFANLFVCIDKALAEATDRTQLIDSFAVAYSNYLSERPEFLRLAAMASSVLEQAVETQIVLNFKAGLAAGLTRAGKQLEARSGLPEGSGSALLLRTYALTLGLWQTYDVPPGLETLLATPALQMLRPDFCRDLPEAISQLWRGAIQHRSDSQ